MDMTGEERIPASREAVWNALNDVDVLRQCIPGCESLEKVSDTDMTARESTTTACTSLGSMPWAIDMRSISSA